MRHCMLRRIIPHMRHLWLDRTHLRTLVPTPRHEVDRDLRLLLILIHTPLYIPHKWEITVVETVTGGKDALVQNGESNSIVSSEDMPLDKNIIRRFSL